MKDVILFGASKCGRVFCDAVNKNICNVVAFADNDLAKQGSKINGIPVVTPKEAVAMNKKIVITSMYRDEISIQLNNLGCHDFIADRTFIFEYLEVKNDKEMILNNTTIDFICNDIPVKFYLPDFYSDIMQRFIWRAKYFYETEQLGTALSLLGGGYDNRRGKQCWQPHRLLRPNM